MEFRKQYGCSVILAKFYDLRIGENSFPLCEYHGYKFAGRFFYEGFDAGKMEEFMESVKNAEIRENDVVLLTYPKCGSHFLKEVIHMIQVGRAEYMGADVPDFPIEYRDQSEVAKVKSPRTIYSHLWYYMLPKQLIKENRGKLIALMRNPKDAFLSFLLFGKGREQQLPINEFANIYIKGDFIAGGWYDWRNELVKGRKENENMLIISYEDCINNLREQVLKIAKHLDKTVSDEFVDDIVSACEINTMREGKKKNIPKDIAKFFGDNYEWFYRKGRVGEWKYTLPDDVNRKFDEWIQSQPDDGCEEIRNYKKFYTE